MKKTLLTMVLVSGLATANDKVAMKEHINEASKFLKKAYTYMQHEKYSSCERYASIASSHISMTLAMNIDEVEGVDVSGERFKTLANNLQKTCKELR